MSHSIYIVCYNMALSKDSDREDIPLLAKKDAFTEFKKRFASLVNSAPNATWFFCLQEIERKRSDEDNQVIQLKSYLQKNTNVGRWRYRTTTHDSDTNERECVAIITNCVKQINSKSSSHIYYGRGDKKRGAVAFHAEIRDGSRVWIGNAHMKRSKMDKDGKLREGLAREIRLAVSKSALSPIVVCGDFNIADADEKSYGKKPHSTRHAPEIFYRTVGPFLNDGFSRGRGYVAGADSATYKSSSKTSDPKGKWRVLDYMLVKEREAVAETQEVLNFHVDESGRSYYLSDHRGLMMKITLPER